MGQNFLDRGYWTDPTAEKSAPGPILQENRIQIRYVEVTASLFWIEAYSLTH